MKEIENYVIYDSKNKEMFVNFFFGIDLLVESEFFYI